MHFFQQYPSQFICRFELVFFFNLRIKFFSEYSHDFVFSKIKLRHFLFFFISCQIFGYIVSKGLNWPDISGKTTPGTVSSFYLLFAVIKPSNPIFRRWATPIMVPKTLLEKQRTNPKVPSAYFRGNRWMYERFGEQPNRCSENANAGLGPITLQAHTGLPS